MTPLLAWFGILVGVLVLAQWAGNFLTRRVPEIRTAPAEIYLHVAAETLMAITLIGAGVLALTGQSIGRPLLAVGFGMTLYSIVNSSGYFAQRREMPPLVMFGVLTLLTGAASLVLVADLR